LGRPGFVAAAVTIYALSLLFKPRWLSARLLGILFIFGGLLIQLITILHFDLTSFNFSCDVPYDVSPQSQYFGWYQQKNMCHIEGASNITFSSYFLMKAVAVGAWLESPVFGIGSSQFVVAWSEAVGNLIPDYYVDFQFPTVQSTYLTFLAEYGLVGFVGWGGFIGIVFTQIKRELRSAEPELRVVFNCWLICFLFVMIDLDVQNFRFLYSLLPLALALSSVRIAARNRTP